MTNSALCNDKVSVLLDRLAPAMIIITLVTMTCIHCSLNPQVDGEIQILIDGGSGSKAN